MPTPQVSQSNTDDDEVDWSAPHQAQIRGHDHGGSRKYDEGHKGDDDDSDYDDEDDDCLTIHQALTSGDEGAKLTRFQPKTSHLSMGWAERMITRCVFVFVFVFLIVFVFVPWSEHPKTLTSVNQSVSVCGSIWGLCVDGP